MCRFGAGVGGGKEASELCTGSAEMVGSGRVVGGRGGGYDQAEGVVDGGEELDHAEGFAHELVDARPGVAAEAGGIEGFEAAGDDDDGQRLLGEAELASERDAGDAGHTIIGDQEIIIVVGEEGPRGGAIGRGVDVKTLRLEDGGFQEADGGVIVGDENAGRGCGAIGDGRDGGDQEVGSCHRSGREARRGAPGGVGPGAESWRSTDG